MFFLVALFASIQGGKYNVKNYKIIPGYYEYPFIFFKFLTFLKFGRNGFFSIILDLNILTKNKNFFKYA